MSRIDGLIQRLCPDGVEYAKIGALAQVGTGSSDRKDASYDGKYPFYVRSKDVMRIDSYEYDEEALLIPGEGGIGEIFHYVNGKYALHQRAYRIHFTDARVHPRFAFFYFSANFKRFILRKAVSATVTSIRKPMVTDFPFPMPPLEVQREIVRELDKFTQLEAELEAELEARRAQYEHYRRELLNGDDADGGRKLSLGEIFEMRAGTHIKTAEISDEPTEDKPYPCYGGNGLRGYVSSYNYDESVILIGRQGALCGNVHRAEGKIYATEHAVVVTPKVQVDMSWAFHKLTEMDLNQYKTKSAQPGLAVGRIKQVEAQYVPFDVQRRDGEVLNKLDALVNDTSIGLPAELNSRRKQYEHYRDRLLMFKEAVR